MTASWKIELVPVPDVDRAKAFYQQLGFTAGHDHRVPGGLRFVQLTPPGPACSIMVGDGSTVVHFQDPDGNKWALQAIDRRPNG